MSCGQRQRRALARVVAALPSVLVLDDPLSALDVDNEAFVEAALRRVLEHTTALIVAHRTLAVALADRVAVMQGGVATELGTHSAMLRRSEQHRSIPCHRRWGCGARRVVLVAWACLLHCSCGGS